MNRASASGRLKAGLRRNLRQIRRSALNSMPVVIAIMIVCVGVAMVSPREFIYYLLYILLYMLYSIRL